MTTGDNEEDGRKPILPFSSLAFLDLMARDALERCMATANDLRRLALALQGTSEAPHFDRAAFKAARIYVTLAADGRSANFKFTPDEQELKCIVAPDAFAPVPNAFGRQGWTTATLSKLKQAELKAALEMAWAHATPKKPKRRKS